MPAASNTAFLVMPVDALLPCSLRASSAIRTVSRRYRGANIVVQNGIAVNQRLCLSLLGRWIAPAQVAFISSTPAGKDEQQTATHCQHRTSKLENNFTYGFIPNDPGPPPRTYRSSRLFEPARHGTHGNQFSSPGSRCELTDRVAYRRHRGGRDHLRLKDALHWPCI